MVARISATAAALLLAFNAFWGDALGAGHVLNPFGILFLLLAALIWFAWNPLREGFTSAKDESDIPIIRLGPAIIGGLSRTFRPRRKDETSSSSS